jgi:hypothetical protein
MYTTNRYCYALMAELGSHNTSLPLARRLHGACHSRAAVALVEVVVVELEFSLIRVSM